jgi:hypothetical protein
MAKPLVLQMFRTCVDFRCVVTRRVACIIALLCVLLLYSVGVPFDPANVEWRCMGCAFIGAVDSSADSAVSCTGGVKSVLVDAAKNHFNFAWLPTGALLVLKAQPALQAYPFNPLVATNGLLLLAVIPAEVIYSGNLAVNWCDHNQVIESPLGRVSSVTALPGILVEYPTTAAVRDTRATPVPTVHVVIGGENRMMMVALAMHKNPVPGQPQSDLARVVWSDVSLFVVTQSKLARCSLRNFYMS